MAKSGMRVVKTREEALQDKLKAHIDKLSDLTFSFPIIVECRNCLIHWALDDFSCMEAIRIPYSGEFVGWVCPECSEENRVFRYHYGSRTPEQEKESKHYYELSSIINLFASAPWHVRLRRSIKRWWWHKRNNNELPYLNSKRTQPKQSKSPRDDDNFLINEDLEEFEKELDAIVYDPAFFGPRPRPEVDDDTD